MSTNNSTKTGNILEDWIYTFFRSEVSAGRFFAKPDCCKVIKKPKYFSRDRGSKIIFDISIEIYMPGSTEFSAVVLIECKNYSHPVPVDDAEEFFTKIQQVAAAKAKGVIATTASFQSGTLEFSRSKGIGLLRYFNPSKCKWELFRSPSLTETESLLDTSEVILGLSDQLHVSEVFDFYLQSPKQSTFSLSTFFKDLFLNNALSQNQIRRIINPEAKDYKYVPYLKKKIIEKIAEKTLNNLDYDSGIVPLDTICSSENKNSGLTVELNVTPSKDLVEKEVLGRISFNPTFIEVFKQEHPNIYRNRFTLAHELSHHLLGHGAFMIREFCNNSDFTLERSSKERGPNIYRMEFQANYLASCLLLPRSSLHHDFSALISELGLLNRGHGLLYLDDQPCNRRNFELVVSKLKQKYGVSRTVVEIRLKELNLVKDARNTKRLNNIIKNALLA